MERRAFDATAIETMLRSGARSSTVDRMTDSDPVFVLKQQLAREICSLVQPVHQSVAAFTLDIDQPLVCRLRHGRVERVSLDRLIRILHRIGRPVTITVGTGPRLRFRFMPWGYLGRLSPRGAAELAKLFPPNRLLPGGPRRRRRSSAWLRGA